MKRVLWLHDSKWSMAPSWVQKVGEKAGVSIEVKTQEENFVPGSFEWIFIMADSVSWNRERILKLALEKGVNPLKIRVFPWKEMQGISPTAVFQIFENFFLDTVTKDKLHPARAVRLLPERRVLVLPRMEKTLQKVLSKLEIHSCSATMPFFVQRQGINFTLYGPSLRETVGAILILPEWQEKAPCYIPKEVEESGRIIPLTYFRSTITQKKFRGKTVVFILPSKNHSIQDWEEVFSLSKDLARNQKARVWILTEEVMVAGVALEGKYRETRSEGVLFEKAQTEKIILQPTTDMRGIWIEFETERDNYHLRFQADWVVYVPKRERLPFPALSWWGGDSRVEAFTDLENPNLTPFSSFLDGVFVFSQFDLDALPPLVQALSDYLTQGRIAVSECASVEEEKCVLCLTCLRTCPWKAVEIDGTNKRKKARINWEQCHLCGICIAFCPAAAIGINSLHLEEFLLIPYPWGDEK